ncbi:hypothetical protein GUG94_07905, partial [Xanthomonas citri pv. citri]|nr:hypothetical protein [Xanthomonas citri pv. citri]
MFPDHPQSPKRLRAQLRPHDGRRRGSRRTRRRPGPDGLSAGGADMSFPILTVIALLPIVGGVITMMLRGA